MARNTGFMEWLDQTRRINKSVDMICNKTIDAILNNIKYFDRAFMAQNEDFFYWYCKYYHKKNPARLIKKMKTKPDKPLMKFAQGSIRRCWEGVDMIRIQWMEIVDYMYDYPNLVNPRIREDEYVCEKINEVCRMNNKTNPLENGTAKKFGKMWKDRNGNWHQEKRRRF